MLDTTKDVRRMKWYNGFIFPLIPTLETKKGDNYNTWRFTFKWLFITIWTIDSPSFEFSIVADTHWGIGLIGLFPFFRWSLTIPCPPVIGFWIDRNLSRSRNLKYDN